MTEFENLMTRLSIDRGSTTWYDATIIWQASRNAALEEAAVAAWSEGMDTYGPFSQLMDPRSVGSLCAKRIRALANKKEA